MTRGATQHELPQSGTPVAPHHKEVRTHSLAALEEGITHVPMAGLSGFHLAGDTVMDEGGAERDTVFRGLRSLLGINLEHRHPIGPLQKRQCVEYGTSSFAPLGPSYHDALGNWSV